MAGELVLEPRNIEDSYVLTRAIETGVSETAQIGSTIAPLNSYPHRQVRVRVREAKPAGLAQFKARGASTPIFRGGFEVVDTYIQLVDLEEMEPIRTDDMLNLYSNDRRIAKLAARDIVDMGRELRQRNINRTEWMRWKAFEDNLTIQFEQGPTIAVDYDLDNTDGLMSSSHKPAATTGWGNVATADIIGDVRTWCDLIEEDLGVPGTILHVNRATLRLMQQNTAIKNYISSWGRQHTYPTEADLVELLNVDTLAIYNGFWKDTGGTKYHYLPDGYVMMTSPYSVEGHPIAEVYDGPVVQWTGTDLVVSENPGAIADIFADPFAKTKYIRINTARMTWLRREAFVWADIR